MRHTITSHLAFRVLGLAKASGPNRFIEDISTPAKLKSYMTELSWERVAGYPVIFNGLSRCVLLSESSLPAMSSFCTERNPSDPLYVGDQ